MARAERQAFTAVRVAKWLSLVFFLALVAAGFLGADAREVSPGVLLLFWTLLAYAMQDRIEKGGVTKEHPGVALVQATLWPGLEKWSEGSLPVLGGFALVSLAFVVAAVFLQHALHTARDDERTDVERRAHRRLGFGLAVLAVSFVVLARPAPEDPPLALVAAPLFFAFLGWSAAHGLRRSDPRTAARAGLRRGPGDSPHGAPGPGPGDEDRPRRSRGGRPPRVRRATCSAVRLRPAFCLGFTPSRPAACKPIICS